jgi:ankyrin repeat protein
VRAAAIIGFLLCTAAVSNGAEDSLGKSFVDAVRNGDVAHTRQLLEQWRATGKSFPLGPDNKPLLFLAIEGHEKTHPEIVELLLAHGADVQSKGPMGMTALHWAASHGDAQRTEQLLQHHPQIEATDDFGRTPLLVAHSLAAEKLLAAHANWMALDKFGNSSLHHAAERGLVSHLELLYRAGFTVVDARNNAGLTPTFRHARGRSRERTLVTRSWGESERGNSGTVRLFVLRFFSGNEFHVPARTSVVGIASMRHEETKWSSGRYRAVKELLHEHGAIAPWRPPPILMIFFTLMMPTFFVAFITGIFFLDAGMTGWRALAQRFPAATEPANVSKHQNGGVGSIGLCKCETCCVRPQQIRVYISRSQKY